MCALLSDHNNEEFVIKRRHKTQGSKAQTGHRAECPSGALSGRREGDHHVWHTDIAYTYALIYILYRQIDRETDGDYICCYGNCLGVVAGLLW